MVAQSNRGKPLSTRPSAKMIAARRSTRPTVGRDSGIATMGVRELKQDASRVLRRVRERGEEIEITHHGRVVARLVPVAPQRPRRPPSAAWSTLDRVAREIGARWPKGWSAARAVRAARRDL